MDTNWTAKLAMAAAAMAVCALDMRVSRENFRNDYARDALQGATRVTVSLNGGAQPSFTAVPLAVTMSIVPWLTVS